MAASTPRNGTDLRLYLLGGILVLWGFAICIRLVDLQIFQYGDFLRRAQRQQQRSAEVASKRGIIYDRTGRELAMSTSVESAFAVPAEIPDLGATISLVARITKADPHELLAKCTSGRTFCWVARKADTETAERIRSLNLRGIYFQKESKRFFPKGDLAAQVLGYVGTDGNGLSGLELQFDKELAGRAGKETVVKDPSGQVIDVQNEQPEIPGKNVYLTLDHSIQANAEEVLRETVHKWSAKSASAIVLDPRTGAILAMATQPGYDANRFPSVPSDLQRNRTITDTYEPGSTFKLMTVAGALSERIVSPTTRFTLPYQLHVADRIIHDAEERGTVNYSVAQILAHSSNIGAITLAEMLGRTRLSSWISKFGFGRTTGVDFPGESPGIVLPPDKWSGSTIGNVPIGQGIAVTPVQMAAAYAAIANRGVWSRPHLVDHVAGGGRPSLNHRRLVAPRIAKQLMMMLKDVVAEGTGMYAAMPGYQVAGKTGTAQKPDASGGYATGRYVASFVGIVPASRPRFVILVTVDEPRGAIWGGVVAAPAFQQIARFDLQYLEVPPDAAPAH